MAQSVRVALLPVLSILRFVGLNTFSRYSLHKSSLWQYYSFLLAFYVLLQYVINISLLFATIDRAESSCSMYLSFASVSFAEMLAAFSSLIVNWKMCDKKIKIICKLSKIEGEVFLLKRTIRYSQFKWRSRILTFIGLLLCLCISDLIVYLSYDSKRTKPILMLRYSARFISWIDIFHFLTIVRIIRLHFECINSELDALAISIRRNFIEGDTFVKVKLLCKMHKSLRKICKIQNRMYSLQIASLMFYIISLTTTLLYFIFINSVYYFIMQNDIVTRLTYIYPYCLTWTFLYYLLSCLTLEIVGETVKEVS